MPDGRLPLVANFGDLSYEKFLEREKRGTTAFERGMMQGLGEAGTSTLKVLDYLVPGRALTRFAEQSEREMQEYYDPYGPLGTAGRTVGRLAGEVAQAGPLAAPLARAAKAVPVAGPAIGRALESRSRLQRALGAAAVGAPIDIAQGLKYETPALLPEETGRLGSIAEGMLITGAVGGLLPRPAQRPIEVRRPQPPGRTVIDTRLVPVPKAPAGAPAAAPVPEGALPMLPAGRPALPSVARRGLPGDIQPEVTPTPTTRPAAEPSNIPKLGKNENYQYVLRDTDGNISGVGFVSTRKPDELAPLVELSIRNNRRVELERAARIGEPPPPVEDMAYEVRKVRMVKDKKSGNYYPTGGYDQNGPVVYSIRYRDVLGEAPTPAARPAVSAEAEAELELIRATEVDNFQRYMEMPLEELKAQVPRILNTKRMTPDQLDASQAYYLRLRDEAMDRAGIFGQEAYAAEFDELSGILRAKYARGEGPGIGYRGAKKYYGNREQARAIQNLSEEQLGYLEERNILPEDYPKMRDAAKRLVNIDKILTRIDDAIADRKSFDFGPRAGFAEPQVIGTVGGGVLGGAAGAATGETPEERRSRALAGFALGAGAGAGLGTLAARRGRVPGGSTEAIRNYNTSIRIGEEAAPERWMNLRQRLYTSVVSETYPMVAAGRVAAGKAGGDAVLEQIARSQGAGGAARQYIDDNVRPMLQVAEGKWDDVRALVKARRDLNIREVGGGYTVIDAAGRTIAEGITPAQLREMGELPPGYTATPERGGAKSAFSDDAVRQAIADAEREPAVKAAADKMNAIYRDLLRLKHEVGILTDEEFQRILQSEDFYDPFVREFGAERAVTGAGGRKYSIESKGISRMDREANAIAETADPLEVLVSSINRTMNVVGRQRVANVLFELADLEELPFIRVVDGPVTPESTRFRQLRNGVPVTYEVTDPDLYEAMAGVAQGPTGGNVFVNFARKVKEVKQFGITQNPFFALFNLGRDITASGIQRPDIARAVQEGVAGAAIGGAAGGFTAEDGDRLRGILRGVALGAGGGMYARPFAEVMGALRNIYRNDDIFKEFLRQGGSTEGFFVRSPSDARRVLQELERTGVSLSDIISPKRWVDAMQAIGSGAEQATRLATYKQMIADGATREAAVFAAQDRTLRFANVGRDTKGIAKVTAFWNAGVQGWDKLFRMLKDPKTATMAAAMITGGSIALWSINKDNPEYWQRPLWERNLFWLIPKADGSGFYRMPKPFEIGYLFASLPERILDYAAQSGRQIPGLTELTSASPEIAEPGRQLRRATGEMAGSTLEGTLPIPDIASLPLQLATNYDLFRARRITTQPNLPAPQQVTPESSALARELAERFGVSPQKTDFAIRNQFGTLGQYANEALDAAIRAAGGEAAERRPKQGLAPRRFVTQQYSQTETESQARDLVAGLERSYAGYRAEQRGRSPERIAEYRAENLPDIKAYNALSGLRRRLDDIASERRAITRNVTLTPERKEELLADLRTQGDAVARKILKHRIAP